MRVHRHARTCARAHAVPSFLASICTYLSPLQRFGLLSAMRRTTDALKSAPITRSYLSSAIRVTHSTEDALAQAPIPA